MELIMKFCRSLLIITLLSFSKLASAGYWYELPMSSAPGPLIAQVQKRLTQKGFSPGAPDGNWGKKTSKAYSDFSKSRGLLFDMDQANALPVGKVLTKEHIKALWNLDFDPNDPTQQEDSINFLKEIGVELN